MVAWAMGWNQGKHKGAFSRVYTHTRVLFDGRVLRRPTDQRNMFLRFYAFKMTHDTKSTPVHVHVSWSRSVERVGVSRRNLVDILYIKNSLKGLQIFLKIIPCSSARSAVDR